MNKKVCVHYGACKEIFWAWKHWTCSKFVHNSAMIHFWWLKTIYCGCQKEVSNTPMYTVLEAALWTEHFISSRPYSQQPRISENYCNKLGSAQTIVKKELQLLQLEGCKRPNFSEAFWYLYHTFITSEDSFSIMYMPLHLWN